MNIRNILLCALCAAWLTGCGGAKEKKEEAEHDPEVPVMVEEARRDSVRRMVTADGILYPADQASIVPKISAPVRSFSVKRGDFVKQGQVVAVLENRDLAATLAENKGLVAQSEAQYKTLTGATLEEDQNKAQQDVTAAKQSVDAARKLFESRQQLFQEGALARRLVDEANVAYAQAKNQYEVAAKHLSSLQNVSRQEQIKNAAAQVESAKARLTGAEAQLSYSEVRSPISGVVTDRPLYPGEMAAAGTPLITVMDVSRVIARINVPVAQAAHLHTGMAATITQTDTGIETQGRVTVVTAAVDPNSTTVQVWVEAPNPSGQLKPGSTVRAAIVVETIPHALVVPKSAILPAQEGAGISTVVVGADNAAHSKSVELGARDGDKVEILKGLNEGDKVVTEGGVGLEDGRKVRIRKPGEKDEDDKNGEKKEDKDDKKPSPVTAAPGKKP
jgi:HlyD family secretion protein